MKSALLILIATTSFCLSGFAQVTALDLEAGIGGIHVGYYLSNVQEFFMKDAISKKEVWDTTDWRLANADKIFLGDMKQPDLDSFHGRKVERIEVYMGLKHYTALELEMENDSDILVVECIRIYLKQEHYDEGAFQDLVGYFYNEYGGYQEEFDSPEKGDMRYTWSGQYFGFTLSNYYGEGTLNRNYDLATYTRN